MTDSLPSDARNRGSESTTVRVRCRRIVRFVSTVGTSPIRSSKAGGSCSCSCCSPHSREPLDVVTVSEHTEPGSTPVLSVGPTSSTETWT